MHLRAILGNIGVTVLPDQVAVSRSGEAFRPDGALVDEELATRVRNLGTQLTHHLKKMLA